MTCESSLKSIWIFLNIFIALIMTGINIVDAAQPCCFSLVSTIQSSPNQYQLNVTASHVDAKKHNNDYVAAISFPQGYVVQGNPSSPYSLADCTLQQTSPPQYQCSEHVDGVFFIQFTVQTPKLAANSSPSASVIIFSDNCQQERFCTDLTAANDNNSDTISLGPLGRWPKYAIIICAVILSLALVGACYLIYRRKTGNSYKDTSFTPGYNDKGANSIFSPRSLLRGGGADDYDEPMPEPPKNTLVQFGNVTNDSEPSVKNRVKSKSKPTNDFIDRQSDSLKKSLSRQSKGSKNEKNHTSEMYNRSNLASEDHSPSVVIDVNYGVDVRDNRKSGDHKKHVSANKKDSTKDFYSSDLSRSTSSRSRDNGAKNGKYETRKESMHQHRRRSNSLSREYDDERKSRGISKTTSRKYRSKSSDREHTRSRELTHGHSMRAKRSDRNDQEIRNSRRVKDTFEKSQDLSRSSTRAKKLSSSATEHKSIEQEVTHRNNSDNDSTTSSDTPPSDRLPLAFIASINKNSSINMSNTLTQDDDDDDDDDEPLGSILNTNSSTGGPRAPVNKRQSNGGDRLVDGSESGRNYDSVLDEMLGFSEYQGSDSSRKGGEEDDKGSEEKINENSSDDDVPVGILRSKIN